jgi:hypothetical protein
LDAYLEKLSYLRRDFHLIFREEEFIRQEMKYGIGPAGGCWSGV